MLGVPVAPGPVRPSPQVAADGLTGDLQDDHGRVQHTQRLDGRDVEGDDVTRVDAYSQGRGQQSCSARDHSLPGANARVDSWPCRSGGLQVPTAALFPCPPSPSLPAHRPCPAGWSILRELSLITSDLPVSPDSLQRKNTQADGHSRSPKDLANCFSTHFFLRPTSPGLADWAPGSLDMGTLVSV